MFVHGGFRPLWPVIFFLPWFFLGVAYLLEWLRLTRNSRFADQRASAGTAGVSSSAAAGIHQSAPRAVVTYSGQR